MRALILPALILQLALVGGCDTGATSASSTTPSHAGSADTTTKAQTMTDADGAPERVVKTEDEWRELLTPEQFRITREAGTERAFTGEYTDTTTPGVYACVCCGAPLFASETKFHSGCGWPAFFNFMPGAITEHPDHSFGMRRIEVRCARCDAHLGHVFNDGPASQGGLRYCINSAALTLDEQSRPPAPDVGH
jgi:peptide-methionine (R)-S-oxide reductase